MQECEAIGVNLRIITNKKTNELEVLEEDSEKNNNSNKNNNKNE